MMGFTCWTTPGRRTQLDVRDKNSGAREPRSDRVPSYRWPSPGELAFEPERRTRHPRRGCQKWRRWHRAEEKLWMTYWSAGKWYLREEALALGFTMWEPKRTFHGASSHPLAQSNPWWSAETGWCRWWGGWGHGCTGGHWGGSASCSAERPNYHFWICKRWNRAWNQTITTQLTGPKRPSEKSQSNTWILPSLVNQRSTESVETQRRESKLFFTGQIITLNQAVIWAYWAKTDLTLPSFQPNSWTRMHHQKYRPPTAHELSSVKEMWWFFCE